MKKASWRQASQFLNLVGQHKLCGRQLQQLFVSGLFTDILEVAGTDGFAKLDRDTVRVALGLPKLTPDPEITELGQLVVPEKITIQEMVRAGEYDGYQPSIELICQHCSITGRGSRRLFLSHFEKDMSNEDLDKVFAAMTDKEEALIEDLLAVGAHPQHRELQRQFPIICRRSSFVANGYRRVPCLNGWLGKRRLDLGYCDVNEWNRDCRFLLVGKS